MALPKSEWNRHFLLQAKSGLSVREYCQRHSIQPSRWYYWRKCLKSEHSDFIPVVIKNDEKPQALRLSLSLGGNCRLTIEGLDSPEGVSKLITLLQRNVA